MPEENTKKLEKLTAKLEALLFIYGEAMDFTKIAKTLKVDEEEIKEAAKALAEELKSENRGLFLMSDKEKIQLTTKPDFSSLLESTVKEELHEALTSASLEALAIVAYAGPLTRAEVEYIRGVNSVFTLRNLLIRGLVERRPDPKRGNVYLYLPSFQLLRHLGVARQSDLPDHERFGALMEKMRTPEIANDES